MEPTAHDEALRITRETMAGVPPPLLGAPVVMPTPTPSGNVGPSFNPGVAPVVPGTVPPPVVTHDPRWS